MRKEVFTVLMLLILMLSLGGLAPALADAPERGQPDEAGLQAMPMAAAGGNGSIVTSDLTGVLTATDLVQMLLGTGVTVSNITFTGDPIAAGTFHADDSTIIGFSDGIILGSGNIADVDGPNIDDGISTGNSVAGDSDLDALIPQSTNDAAVLEFDFVADSELVTFEYVFTSDEYNEFVNSSFNDVFAFFLDGSNIALIPGTGIPVAINNVHSGNPYDITGATGSYPQYYRNNDTSDGGGAIDTEMDGLTTVFTAVASGLTPGGTHHIKLAIADAGDYALDSNVFIRAESFVSGKLSLTPPDATNDVNTSHTVTAKVLNAAGQPVEGATVTFTVTGANSASGTDDTDVNGEATFTYTGTNKGIDTITATCDDPDVAGVVLTATANKTWTDDGPIVPGPGMTGWGILATALVLGGLTVVMLRKRRAYI